MNISEELANSLASAMTRVGLTSDTSSIHLEYPENPEHGDYSTNVALVCAKRENTNPQDLAKKIVEELQKDQVDFIESINIAGPGFINFKIKDEIFVEKIIEIANGDGEYGWSQTEKDKQVMVEYTDPNPFKIFHIGHLMSNAVGESISRLIQSSGSEVIRACYQGDVGLHVAKTVWAIKNNKMEGFKKVSDAPIKERVAYLGSSYSLGNMAYEGKLLAIISVKSPTKNSGDQSNAKKEIEEINKNIFEKSDPEINEIYEKGRTWSLEYFEEIYKRLDTKFDKFFFESEVADLGMKIVKEFMGKTVFEESDGAVIFKGEDHGLHTRVFLTSSGLPTYETKELGLNTEKFKQYPKLDQSIIITANEQNDYFKVLLKVFSLIDSSIAEKTKHINHGILRFASGKMSSRKGNVIAAETLIDEIKSLAKEKIASREFTIEETEEISDTIAIAAIKYTILRQSIGGDVVFDSAASISFDGDSGPYLQYSAVRAAAVLNKAKEAGIEASPQRPHLGGEASIEKLIVRFPEIVSRALSEYAPQHIAGYLISLASAFNSFYASNIIVDKDNSESSYRVAVTRAFLTTMTNGLWLLGIKVPKKM